MVVDCRRDWYQTQDKVIISIFAKKVNKSSTTVIIGENTLKVDITFEDSSTHQYHTTLFQPVNQEESRFEILSTKIEINLKKSNGYSWASIEQNSSTNI